MVSNCPNEMNYFGLSTRQKREKFYHRFFDQTGVKGKPILSCFLSFCRVLLQLHVFALFTGLPAYVVILSQHGTFTYTLII